MRDHFQNFTKTCLGAMEAHWEEEEKEKENAAKKGEHADEKKKRLKQEKMEKLKKKQEKFLHEHEKDLPEEEAVPEEKEDVATCIMCKEGASLSRGLNYLCQLQFSSPLPGMALEWREPVMQLTTCQHQIHE